MTIINYYYMIGGIVGACSIIAVVLKIGLWLFFPKIQGALLAQKMEISLIEIKNSLHDLKKLIGDRRGSCAD